MNPGERLAKAAAEIKALKELSAAEIRRLDEEMETQVARWQEAVAGQRAIIDALSSERLRASEKFEDSVARRFVQQNEFRASLDDLGKQMATRRELETAVAGIKAETATALTSATARVEEQGRQLVDLRSRLDIGPLALQGLKDRSEQATGAAIRGKELVAYAFSSAIVVVALVGVLVAVLNH